MSSEEDRLSPVERVYADQIRKLRELLGWSQDDLALRMRDRGLEYMNQATVSRLENKTRPVRMVEAVLLSDLFHVQLSTMLHPDGRALQIRSAEVNLVRAKAALKDMRVAVDRYTDYWLRAQESQTMLSELTQDDAQNAGSRAEYQRIVEKLGQLTALDPESEAVAAVAQRREGHQRHVEHPEAP